jgi:hypothetical protein
MKIRNLTLKLFTFVSSFAGLFLTTQNDVLAQYGGAVQGGQVLGEETQSGIPTWIFILIALGILFIVLYFANRHKKN